MIEAQNSLVAENVILCTGVTLLVVGAVLFVWGTWKGWNK